MKLLLLIAIAGCSIEHPSDLLACTTQADCDASRTCTNGFCVVGGTAGGCPTGCTTCDTGAKTCTMSGNNSATCPAGYHCTITCGGDGACNNVDCSMAASCMLTCSGQNSCDQVRCSGACAIACTGDKSCANVSCRNACSCDVTCSNGADCGNLSCPSGCGTNQSCSSQPATCHSC